MSINSKRNIKSTLSKISKDVLNGQNFSKSDYLRQVMYYPAMMVPSAQEPILKTLIGGTKKEINLFDPFMGAANTLMTGMKYGINVYGQDINPLSLLISQVKTANYNPKILRELTLEIMGEIKEDKSIKKEVKFNNINKWFQNIVQIELSKIFRAIRSIKSLKYRKYFWVILSEVIRLTSNDRTSTFKLHIRSNLDINNRKVSPIALFDSFSERNLNHFMNFQKILHRNKNLLKNKYKHDVSVKWGDTKKKIRFNKRFDLVMTSPPYGDNQTTVTYGQFSYLPLQWIPRGDIDKDIEFNYLDEIQRIDSSSLGGKKIKKINERSNELFTKSKTLNKLFKSFSNTESKKAEKIINFIHDIDLCIDKLLPKMKQNSYMVWTLGNRNVNNTKVENDKIIKELFHSKNIGLISKLERKIISKRMPNRNNFSRTMERESISIFKIN